MNLKRHTTNTAVVLKWQLSLLVMMNNRSQMEVPILDKGIDDWGSDEQEEAYDKLQQLKKDFEGSPTKLYINNNEELQSYMLWFARMDGLPCELTDGETRIC